MRPQACVLRVHIWSAWHARNSPSGKTAPEPAVPLCAAEEECHGLSRRGLRPHSGHFQALGRSLDLSEPVCSSVGGVTPHGPLPGLNERLTAQHGPWMLAIRCECHSSATAAASDGPRGGGHEWSTCSRLLQDPCPISLKALGTCHHLRGSSACGRTGDHPALLCKGATVLLVVSGHGWPAPLLPGLRGSP